MNDLEDLEEIKIINAEDAAYPLRMAGLPQMPGRLYVIGEMPSDERPSCAIVGARHCTGYGRGMAASFAAYLAQREVQIVSGMALGIDACALQGALSVGGKAYAVLGCGVDVCYPKTNVSVYEAMKISGGIISEETPGSAPLPYRFPKRNRIISALSDIVLVVEARLKSGSLYTVDHALEQGRTVFAVPGRVGEPLSDGCHFLISQGAEIARSPEAVYEYLCDYSAGAQAKQLRRMRQEMRQKIEREDALIYKKKEREEERRAALLSALPKEEAMVVAALEDDPLHADDIYQKLAGNKTPLTMSALSAVLVALRLKGVIREVGKNLFVLRDL